MAIVANGYIRKDFGTCTKFSIVAYGDVSASYCHLVIYNAILSYLYIMTAYYAVWSMWKKRWRCKVCSAVEIRSKRAMMPCIHSFYPKKIVQLK